MTFQTTLKISKKLKAKSGQQGVTLLLAILLLSAILAISFSVATILLFQVRNSEDFAQTSGALYAANGVGEQALFNTERQVASSTYVSSFSNNAVLTGPPVSTSTTTPIFHDSVAAASSFAGTKNKYDFCGSAATTAGCGYGKLVLTYLSTGNTDPLIVYLCQFDPNQDYGGAPCTSTSTPEGSASYWITTDGTVNGSGSGIIDGGPAYPNGTLMTPGGAYTLTWNVNPLLQQQLILYDPATDGKPIYVSMESFAADGVTPLGLPFSGKTAVSVSAVNGQTGRKIQVVVPAPGNSANVVSIPVATDVVPTPASKPWSIFVSGGYAYVGDYSNATMSIYDISTTPGTATFVNSTSANLTANTWDIAVSGNYAYALNYNAPYNMAIFNIQDPHNIIPVTTINATPSPSDGQPNKVVISGNRAYVLTKLGNLAVYDITHINDGSGVVTLMGDYTYPGYIGNVTACRGLSISFPYAYVTCANALGATVNSLQIFNISNPSSITALDNTTANLDQPYSIYVSGSYAYVGNWSDVEGISIFDISNPNPGGIVPKDHNSSNVNSSQSINLKGNEAYILNAETGTLAMFNVANVNGIIENNEISVGAPWSPGNMVISGQYGYLTNYGNGNPADANITVLRLP